MDNQTVTTTPSSRELDGLCLDEQNIEREFDEEHLQVETVIKGCAYDPLTRL